MKGQYSELDFQSLYKEDELIVQRKKVSNEQVSSYNTIGDYSGTLGNGRWHEGET